MEGGCRTLQNLLLREKPVKIAICIPNFFKRLQKTDEKMIMSGVSYKRILKTHSRKPKISFLCHCSPSYKPQQYEERKLPLSSRERN